MQTALLVSMWFVGINLVIDIYLNLKLMVALKLNNVLRDELIKRLDEVEK